MSSVTRMMSMVLSLQIITAFFFITATVSSSDSSQPGGFTMDLIQHRSKSNSSSFRRSNIDNQLRATPYADVAFDTYEYLMKLQIGTPPVEIEAILDTGSEVVWTQCLPCINCFNQSSPIFDPSKSSTYKKIRCTTPDQSCDYDVVYGDKSYSIGSFVSETVSIKSTSGQSYVMPETIIGCSHNNSAFKTSGSGIVGLNWKPLSLISQMGKHMLGAISYCFSPEGTSNINFGSNAIVSGEGTVTTPMFKKKEGPGLYYLNLDAVSVEKTRIETLGTPFHASDGNIVIDSGSTLTTLPASYCSLVREAVEKFVEAERVTSKDGTLCYKTNTMDVFPVITMHFTGGADLVLGKTNTYMAVNGGDICLAIICGPTIPLPGGVDAIFGNRAQNNFLVGYDDSSRLFSFKPTDCGVKQDIPRDSVSAASFLQFNITFVLFIYVLSLIRL
ncbi:unnamed protein product [Eruca vesicaria subsp. sativa]|uniref:Peptidase A1 domain-containing protein n=1 Tax=Eruca vesicaria subsp. sativa TaxID=29727 RepID=A0ABC8KQQ8_ERUVS|nr:unnamed protein product [Eruca vesicaria subsp. sativa]